MEREIIESLDYSHPWVTAKEHILQVHEEALKLKGGMALDVGCFQGHSALAMALAGMKVSLVDIDRQYIKATTDKFDENASNLPDDCGNEVAYWVMDSAEWIGYEDDDAFDLVMHDAQHGEQVVPELLEYWSKAVKPGGTLIVHDTDQIDLANLILQMGNPKTKTTEDGRGRYLTIFYKP